MRLAWKTFSGLIPKVSPRNLPDTAAQVANNCWLAETDLQPIKTPLFVTTLADALQKSIYLWRRGGSEEWLSWDRDVDVVRGPIADDQYSRIYYTDGTTLHMNLWDSTIATPKVEVADVSMTPPGAPTITKTKLFDPLTISATFLGNNLSLASYDWDGDNLKLTFHAPSTNSFDMNAPLRLHVGSYGYTPANIHDPQADIYEDILTLGTFGRFQVISISNENYISSPVPPSGFSVPFDKVVTVKMNYVRTNTQYQYYVATTVNIYGQESPPSAVSAQVKWEPNDVLSVTSPAGRLYRSATGLADSNFYYLGDTGGTFVDNVQDSALSEILPLIENPPAQMTGLVSIPGGFLAAFNGKDLFFSEPYLPYSWPTRYRLTMDYDIVGLAVNGNDLIVLTTGNPYYISGTHPDIIQQSKMPVEQSCISKKSIAFSEKFVCYASPDGLCGITGGNVSVVTSQYYTRAQWQELTPQEMIGSVHDGRYIGWLENGAIIIDFKESNATLGTTDVVATGVYSDLENDQLYLIQGATITDWMAGSTSLLATWKSKEYQNVQDAIFNSAKVISEAYTNTTFKIYADGVLVWSYKVADSRGFRVPNFDRSARWSISIETYDRVYEVVVASSMSRLRIIDGIKE